MLNYRNCLEAHTYYCLIAATAMPAVRLELLLASRFLHIMLRNFSLPQNYILESFQPHTSVWDILLFCKMRSQRKQELVALASFGGG